MEYWTFPMDMESSGAAGALVKEDAVPPGGNSVTVYFGCQDCAVEAERAKAAGGQIREAKMAIGEHGFISLVTDTEGNVIGLHSMQ
ncbi:Glyoxalase-like domain protein [compost metagenome]